MVRNLAGFVFFAFLASLAVKILTGLFGWILGLALTVLVWALIGFTIYTLLKIFFPDTAAWLRSTFSSQHP